MKSYMPRSNFKLQNSVLVAAVVLLTSLTSGASDFTQVDDFVSSIKSTQLYGDDACSQIRIEKIQYSVGTGYFIHLGQEHMRFIDAPDVQDYKISGNTLESTYKFSGWHPWTLYPQVRQKIKMQVDDQGNLTKLIYTLKTKSSLIKVDSDFTIRCESESLSQAN